MTDAAQPMSDLAAAPWLRRRETQAVLNVLAAGGHEARIVGGAVRNGLIGRPVTDVDIATTAPPDSILALARTAGFQAVPTGIAHGTVTVVVDGQPYEVTTLRRDVETFGRHATVAFTDDWVEDAKRRDFTINALYCDADGRVFDPLGGLGDLAARRVRFVGDPDDRIREDYLRILRFFRFHAAYGAGAPDRAALDAAVRHRHGLAQLSGERVRQELLKLLVAPGVSEVIAAMAAFGVLVDLLAVAPRPGMLGRLIAVEAAAGLAPDATLRLAALTVAVAEDAERLQRRLRLSSAEGEVLRFAAGMPDTRPGPREAEAREALYRLGADAFCRAVLWRWAAATEDGAVTEEWLGLLRLPERWAIPVLPVGGRDVLALGVKPGPAVGDLLAAVEAWWIGAGFPSDRDGVLAALAGLAARKP